MNLPHRTISVVMLLRSGGRFVAQALDAVFAQTLPATEVIVVGDGMASDERAMIDRYATVHPLSFLQRPERGYAAAANFGVGNSRGDLIAFVDQDDRWYPDHLSKLFEPFSNDSDGMLGWTYSNYDEVAADGQFSIRETLSVSPNIHPKMRLDQCLAQDMGVLASTSLICRAAFDAIGGFDEALHGYEDDDFFVRLFTAGYRNVYIEKSLTRSRVRPDCSSIAPAVLEGRMLYAQKLLRSFPDDPSRSRFHARDLIAPRFMNDAVESARVALRSGDTALIDACMADIALLESTMVPGQKLFPIRRDLLITAIVPLYNGGPFIQRSLQSVFDQEIVPDEVIVVDDGSTDDGPRIVAEMAQRFPIRLLRKENGGQSSARNFGVDHAHGDLIAFLDQDDIWYPDHLSELVKPFLETRAIELGWAYSNLDEIDEAGNMVSRDILSGHESDHPKRDLSMCLRRDMFVLPSASVVSRKAFRCVGGFDERLSGYEDDDLFLRMFLAGYDNVYVANALSKWRIYMTSSSYSQRMAQSRTLYARKLIDRFPDDPERSRWHVRDMIAPRFFVSMAHELRRATFKGTKAQQEVALADLRFIVNHLGIAERLALKTFLLPAFRFPLLARFIMRHRMTLLGLLRRSPIWLPRPLV